MLMPASSRVELVNSGSKLATLSSESTMGLKGGVICFLYKRSQSIDLKKGCSFNSAAPRLAPRRFWGLRLRRPLTNCLPSSPMTEG
jgi:hypothetical protein